MRSTGAGAGSARPCPRAGASCGLRASSRGGEPTLDCSARSLDRLQCAGDYELRVGEEQGGLELKGDLSGVLRRIDVALGLGVANGRLEPSDPVG